MVATSSPADLVRQLRRAGLRPSERLVEQILAPGPAARSELLKLATNTEDLHAPMPATLGPLHALRLLGELPDVSIIAPLLEALPAPTWSETDVPARLYNQEALEIIGRTGAPALPALLSYADDESHPPLARMLAMACLSYVATRAPEVRDTVIVEARHRLEAESARPVSTGAAMALSDLGDKDSYQVVMAAYRAGRVDQAAAPAATARQYLLGGGRASVGNVHYGFFERYDRYGPFLRSGEDEDFDDDEY
ncbi:MAG: hypothetical protein RMK84_02960 [Oscillochloridaceae bacterium]|nr:hypothetical protein [Chloroflexaceae bacterium]MDW8389062.1 hypothetical protein [Oscillochloridaceae bacterium]